MSLKETVFKSLNVLPNSVSAALLRLNRYPQKIYGAACLQHKDKVSANAFSSEELHALLLDNANHAIKHVPYYQQRYTNLQLKHLDEFKDKFATIDKTDVMTAWAEFVSDDIQQEHYVEGTTGGTTGKPMKMLMPSDRYIVELGSVLAQWGAYGFDFSPRAVLRNHKPRRSYSINPVSKEFQFNGYDFSDRNFALLYSTMKKYGLQFLQCYPSSGHEFANYLARKRLDTSIIKAFFVSSEAILPQQRLAVEALGIRYFSLYGHSEKLVMAGTCPYSDVYHIVPGYGCVELLDEHGQQVNEEGATGEIVGSSLRNHGFPLLRYRTGDFATYTHLDCECGYRGPAFRDIMGRWNGERVYNRDGSFVTTTALNLHSDLYAVIDGLQYVQHQQGELIVRIIPNESFTEKHQRRFDDFLRSSLKDDTKIRIEKVSELERQSNGKFLFLISKVKL